MVRFIDLSGQIYCDDTNETRSFAFFNTIKDEFMTFWGVQYFDTKNEFIEAYMHEYGGLNGIDRFVGKIPNELHPDWL